jgi:tellurite resistance protein TerC
MELPVWFEVGSLVVLVLILVADLLLILKRPHIPSTRESTLWVVFYVTLALLFAGMLWLFAGHEFAGQFIAGWLTEYSLDRQPLRLRADHGPVRGAAPLPAEVLMVGIIIALVLRGLFILAGAAIIEQFSWVFYIFGAFLIWTAWRQAFPGGDHDDDVKQESFVVRTAPSDGRHQRPLRRRQGADGRRQAIFTPMIIVFVGDRHDRSAVRDRLDPGDLRHHAEPVHRVHRELFALMGLRQLYFLLGDLLDRLKYLHYGIAFILAFIGVKLFFHAMHVNELPFINGGEHIDWAPEISTWMSLGVIVLSMVVATVASLIASARSDAPRPPRPRPSSRRGGRRAEGHTADRR